MDIDSKTTSKEGEERGKPIVVILVGAPGSGKSTFCEDVMRSTSRPWVRICQDTIGNGKSGTKAQCLNSAAGALNYGKSVFIDRCNLEREQRADFVKLGDSQVDVHAVVLDLPAKLCISRSVKRTGHEGNLQGGKAAAVVNRMLQKKEFPKLSEGFSRITFCQNESDVQGAVKTYSTLSELDTLPSGCFGQKNPDAKIQLGIMKFLKKVDVPVNARADTKIEDIDASSRAPGNTCLSLGNAGKELKVSEEHAVSSGSATLCLSNVPDNAGKVVNEGEGMVVGSDGGSVSLNDVPTLAFPSISTADFQFNIEKASDIIVDKVEEFTRKVGSARLVLVDLSHGSKILSLVRIKAAQKGINSDKFFTFVGDITQLYTGGGLRCNVIANAANWRLKPGGGGVNAAIFNAAGPALEAATKEQAGSLQPGKAVVVPLPSSSPLHNREGVTHVIHVLGPNMNPQRPNCLKNDYIKGCKVLREAYSSLFEGFASLVRSQPKSWKESSESLGPNLSKLRDHLEEIPRNHFSNSDQKIKRESVHKPERNKKCKGSLDVLASNNIDCKDQKEIPDINKNNKSLTKNWGSWAQALYHIAMHPERYKNDVLEISDDFVVVNDLYPKAQKHVLVLTRCEGLDCLANVRTEHLQLLKNMHAMGFKWAEKFLSEDATLVFRLGYHSVPSMRQLHLHVISQDFNSNHLKNKKHWNSFNSAFFRDSVDVIEEISSQGKATIKDDVRLLSTELRCHRCRSAHPNIPRLKSHISNCKAPFLATLLQNGRLVLSHIEAGSDP